MNLLRVSLRAKRVRVAGSDCHYVAHPRSQNRGQYPDHLFAQCQGTM